MTNEPGQATRSPGRSPTWTTPPAARPRPSARRRPNRAGQGDLRLDRDRLPRGGEYRKRLREAEGKRDRLSTQLDATWGRETSALLARLGSPIPRTSGAI